MNKRPTCNLLVLDYHQRARHRLKPELGFKGREIWLPPDAIAMCNKIANFWHIPAHLYHTFAILSALERDAEYLSEWLSRPEGSIEGPRATEPEWKAAHQMPRKRGRPPHVDCDLVSDKPAPVPRIELDDYL